MTLVRHFTATAFVVHDDHVVLHWHSKVKAWLPPGGHIDDNEDPVEAALREIQEETGLLAEVVPTGQLLDITYPTKIEPPFTIMVEDIDDPVEGYHQHIDMIYFCRLAGPPDLMNKVWQWVSKEQIAASEPLERWNGAPEAPPEDVRILASHAFEIVGNSKITE